MTNPNPPLDDAPSNKTEARVAALNAESLARLGHLRQERATQKFGKPKTRRCQSCFEVFDCARIEDILCAGCVGKRPRVPVGAQLPGGEAA